LNFCLPGSATKQFYLIRQYNGRDGKVWLSTNISGRLAMVKFRKNTSKFSYTPAHVDEKKAIGSEKKQDDADTAIEQVSQEVQAMELNGRSKARAELNHWNQAYGHLGAKPFIAKLAAKEALVLPFSFTYQANGVLPLQLSCYLPCTESFGERFNDWCTAQSLLRVASEVGVVDNLLAAIKTLASKSVCHKDIKLEHLALLPVFEDGTMTRVEPILIDLADVDLTRRPLDAFSCMCSDVMESEWFNNDQKTSFRERASACTWE
jgi:hypothetical protein